MKKKVVKSNYCIKIEFICIMADKGLGYNQKSIKTEYFTLLKFDLTTVIAKSVALC